MSGAKDQQEFLVYMDGKMVPEGQATISVFDRGFHGGDSVHEAIRSFDGELFKLPEHTARLFRSLKAARIDPGMTAEEMNRISQQVFDANKHLRNEHEDFWIYQHVSSGMVPQFEREGVPHKNVTVVVFAFPLPFKAYAKYYEVGAHVVTAWTRRISPLAVDPKIKTCSRMELYIASREVKLVDSEAYCLLLDERGAVSEGMGYNFFIVHDGVVRTAGSRNVLEGVSRATVIGLADELGIPCQSGDLQTYDIYNAEEAFLTATSFCILPVCRFNGVTLGAGRPGPVTKRLLEKWSETVGVDIPGQALGHLKS